MDAYTGETLSFNIGYLPISYIDFGKVITNRLSLMPIADGLTVYTSGLIVLAGTLIVTELTLYLTSKRMTRQKFIALGAK